MVVDANHSRRNLLNTINKTHARLLELQDDRGATAVEYGLMVALIAAVIVVAVGTLGGQVNTAFEFVSD
ncbi:MAG: Flp family type IVb pilin, partial [Acidobacteria bacterium]|nr:Flp family type IVb pilin [Acidobacteriota bacterium]